MTFWTLHGETREHDKHADWGNPRVYLGHNKAKGSEQVVTGVIGTDEKCWWLQMAFATCEAELKRPEWRTWVVAWHGCGTFNDLRSFDGTARRLR